MLQTTVEIVKPGGTGRPALVISASPAPLPPSRSFMLRLPSAFSAPKKYTYLAALTVGFFLVAFFDIHRSVGRILTWGHGEMAEEPVQHYSDGLLAVTSLG